MYAITITAPDYIDSPPGNKKEISHILISIAYIWLILMLLKIIL